MPALAAPVPACSNGEPLWLEVGALFDGTDVLAGPTAHLVYDADRIRYVGTTKRPPPPHLLRPGQTTPDAVLPEHTVLPGLIEAHAHLFLTGGELDPERRAAMLQQSPAELLAAAQSRLAPLVRLGITAVRDAGDRHGVGLALSRQDQQSERVLMPYVDSPGAAIHRRGRYGSFMGGAVEDHASLADCVAERVAAGADRIKLIPTGIINFKTGTVTAAPQFSAEELRQLVAAARTWGRQTFAHASGDVGIDHAIDGGVDSIEHGFFLRDDQLTRLRDRQIAWVPTFAPVQAQVTHAVALGWDDAVLSQLRRILDQHRATLAQAHQRGVCIIAGSDAGSLGVPHGYGFLAELEAMEAAGLPALDVLRSATGTPSRRLAFREPLGRLAMGYRSRFVLTRYSPFTTVAQLRRPRTVVFDGNVYEIGEGVSPDNL